jgi:TPR repeat protein
MDGDAYERGALMGKRGDYAEAHRLFLEAGEDARALLALGQLASGGLGEEADPAKAAKLYWRAANLGSADAAYNLGALYGSGRGVPQDSDTALQWYAKAGELGCAAGYRVVGRMYAEGDGRPADLAQAEPWWMAAARAGDPAAMADVASVIATRYNDPVTAAEWYLKAHDSGHTAGDEDLLKLRPRLAQYAQTDPRAAKALGVVLKDLAQDDAGAIEALNLPAHYGDPVAQRTLALLLMKSPDRPVDRILRLLDASARAGDGWSAYTLAGIFARGDGVPPDPGLAVQWARLAIASGVTATYALMAGFAQRPESQLGWYLDGAAAGDAACIEQAAQRYRDGVGTPVDRVQALRWFLVLDGPQAEQSAADLPDELVRQAGYMANRVARANAIIAARAAGAAA